MALQLVLGAFSGAGALAVLICMYAAAAWMRACSTDICGKWPSKRLFFWLGVFVSDQNDLLPSAAMTNVRVDIFVSQ